MRGYFLLSFEEEIDNLGENHRVSVGHKDQANANCNQSAKFSFAVVFDAFEKSVGYFVVKDNSECAANNDENANEEPKRAKLPLHGYILAQ